MSDNKDSDLTWLHLTHKIEDYLNTNPYKRENIHKFIATLDSQYSIEEHKVETFTPEFINLTFPTRCTVVDFNTSKQLKELGFDLPTYRYWRGEYKYSKDTVLHNMKKEEPLINHNKYDSFIYSAPTKEQVESWLKVKNK